ncbi:zinc-binding dehydrogenase [Corynebacterium sp.]|uniref:zinc-binding dehydrogenase n=1 Tax=Corynebacterium sp. TaxID=1720 RepID=UPI0026E0A584|nr:zinc-binding dehydrogenase [Corynebacterium sp.]MDO5513069.1 zinc-binding dehydrogenase [Corynebacterium sp.]
MKAWQFTNTHEPLVLNEVPDPVAGEGEVVLEMKAAGLCHSDVGLLEDEGWLSMLAKRPITIGHENAGVVAEVGPGVTEFAVGDRVGVCPTTAAGAPGYSFDGGFAPKMAVAAEALVPLPDNVDFLQGAAATDAGMTSYAAVITQGGVKEGDVVGIIGLGGLGQIGAKVAMLAGADVYVAEVNEKVWPLAEELGAKGVKKSITEFEDVTFDVIVDFAGFDTTTAQSVDIIRRDGTVVVVGMGKLESTISTKSLILNQARLVGSNGGTKEDIAGVYEYMATGKLNPTITTIGFDEIPEGIEKLKNGEVVGRLVASFE